jgi:hypothetical protein
VQYDILRAFRSSAAEPPPSMAIVRRFNAVDEGMKSRIVIGIAKERTPAVISRGSSGGIRGATASWARCALLALVLPASEDAGDAAVFVSASGRLPLAKPAPMLLTGEAGCDLSSESIYEWVPGAARCRVTKVSLSVDSDTCPRPTADRLPLASRAVPCELPAERMPAPLFATYARPFPQPQNNVGSSHVGDRTPHTTAMRISS